mgnify:FL=1
MNFLDFINKKNTLDANKSKFFESYKASDTDKVIKLIDKIIRKHVSANILMIKSPDETIIDGQRYLTYTWGAWTGEATSIKKFTMLLLNYKISETSGNVYSVSFMNGQDWWNAQVGKKAKTPLTIYSMGTSIIYMLPLIYKVLNTGDFNVNKSDIERYSNQIFKEALTYKWHFNALTYDIYENLSDENISDMYRVSQMIDEAVDKDVKSFRADLKQKVNNAYNDWKSDKTKEKREIRRQLEQEYQTLLNAIRGGATTMEDIKVALKRNLNIEIDIPESVKEAEKKVETYKDPKQQFKEMAVYVNGVIKGIQPGVILCGAPGIGKTYKVMQHLKAAGKRLGQNLEVFKGKASMRELYKSMYEYQNAGDIILIDDADSLVGKNAPEDCINLLKAALDSTSDDESRYVTYKIAGRLTDDDGTPIPKAFHYRGGIIVITNYTIDKLDKAFRGRVFTQTLRFSNEQVLGLIKELVPTMDSAHLSMKSKMKAFDYIANLVAAKAKIDISIRMFVTCSKLYENQVSMGDVTDDDVKSMIKEQLENQALG